MNNEQYEYTAARATRTNAVRQQLLRQTQHRQRRIPLSLDLHYITDRLLVASQPAGFVSSAAEPQQQQAPSNNDTGRDTPLVANESNEHESANHDAAVVEAAEVHQTETKEAPSTSAEIKETAATKAALLPPKQPPEQQPATATATEDTAAATEEPPTAEEAGAPAVSSQVTTQSPSESASLSSRPSPLDLVLGGRESTGGADGDDDIDDTSLSLPSDLRSRRTGASSSFNRPTMHHHTTNDSSDDTTSAASASLKRPRMHNSPAALASILDKRHGLGNYLLFSLSDDSPDEGTATELRRQIVQLSWKSPGQPASETPTIQAMLETCYALTAWLHLDQVGASAGGAGTETNTAATSLLSWSSRRPTHYRNVAVLYCANGKTRSAIAAACFLKFTGVVETTRDGFVWFLQQRCPDSQLPPLNVLEALPASLHTFFGNFDDVVQLQTYLNPRPLLLRAVALQGVPVEDKPCLDLWNANGQHVYSSHPEMFDDLVVVDENTTTTTAAAAAAGGNNNNNNNHSQWGEEEGFYRVNQIIQGDFLLLCRFGGPYAQDIDDTSKIIFRYANTTGFLGAGGPLELVAGRVDLMRRYAHLIDGHDFLLSLMFEAAWNCSSPHDAALLQTVAEQQQQHNNSALAPVLQGYDAMERGWHIISERHVAQQSESDRGQFLQNNSTTAGTTAGLASLRSCPDHIVSLALQLSNFDSEMAEELLYSRLRSWWSEEDDAAAGSGMDDDDEPLEIDTSFNTTGGGVPLLSMEHLQARDRILNLVQETDIFSSLAEADRTRGGLLEMPPSSSSYRPPSMMFPADAAAQLDLMSAPSGRFASPAMQPRLGDILNAFGSSKPRLDVPPSPHRAGATASGALGEYESSSNNTNNENNDFFGQPALPVLPRTMTNPVKNQSRLDDPANHVAVELLMALDHPGVGLEDLLQLQKTVGNLDNPNRGRDEENATVESTAAAEAASAVKEPNGDQNKAAISPAVPAKDKNVGAPKTAEQAFEEAGSDNGAGSGDGKAKPTVDSKESIKNNLASVLQAKLQPDGGPADGAAAVGKETGTTMEDDSKEAIKNNLANMLQSKLPNGPPAAAEKDASAKVDDDSMQAIKNNLANMLKAKLPSGPPGGGAGDKPSGKEDDSSKQAIKNNLANMLKAKLPNGPPAAAEKDSSAKKDDDPKQAIKNNLANMLKAKLPSGPPDCAAAEKEAGAKNDDENDPPLKDDPCFAKYFKMLKMKLPRPAVEHAMIKDGADVTLLDLDPEKSLKSQRKADSPAEEEEVPLKDDPCFSKYFKMLKMRLPRPAVEHAMIKDGADVTLLDLDPEKSLKSQRKGSDGDDEDDGPPLKEDPCFSKYYKMLKMRLPRPAVEHAMIKDGADVTLLDLDPEKSLRSQRKGGDDDSDDGLPLKDDPCFSKYYKMLKMKLPRGAVENAMARDNADVTLLDLDPEKSLKSQRKGDDDVDDGPPLKDDPCFSKYYKMLKMKLPRGAVENAMARDNADVTLLDLDPEKSLKSQRKGDDDVDDGPPLKDDPCFSKYYKMLKMKLPRGAVENAMARDGADVTLLDLDPEKSLKSQRKGGDDDDGDDGPPLKDDPCFSKYYKMLKMKLPRGAVENAMGRDGADVTLLDLDPEKSLKSQRKKDSGPPLKEDPCFSKYYKMLKMKLPRGAVENAMVRDGADVTLLDLDPEKSLSSQRKGEGGAKSRNKAVKKKKRVRRKKIYWNPIDPREIKKDSLWSIVKGRFNMNKLDYDVKEFEDLFTESAEPGDKKKKKTSEKPKAKKSVQVIDGKRSMNGGIILKRLKMENKAIAETVDSMEPGRLDATSLKALKELLPTADERKGLSSYVERAGKTEEKRAAAIAELSECERYMLTIMDVPDAAAKYDCLLFRDQFRSRYDELVKYIRVVEKACDEVRTSEKLQQIIAMILTLVNQINTGGDGNEAAGFSLDALLKLNEAKAFDRKTSVLQYLAKLVKRNDETLLDFYKDLAHVAEAENIIMDSLSSDMKALQQEVETVHETVKVQAEALEEAGETIKFSVKELAEQRSSVRKVGNVPQYNKIDHHTGRTPMERFTLNAVVAIEDAVELAETVKAKFRKLLEYFGEDEKMPSNEFFGTMRRFVAEFTKSVKVVATEEKKKLKEQQRAAKKASAQSKSPSPAAAGAPGSPLDLAELARKSGKKDSKVSVPGNNGQWSGVPGITIAATTTRIDVSTPTKEEMASRNAGASPSASGIAALAARAAAAKEKTNESKKAGGSVAAMAAAAAAAAAKNQKAESKNVGGSVAAMAAAAAKGKTGDTKSVGGSVAAMAAAAAASKSKTTESKSVGGSVAAMAAAAAAKKKASEPKNAGGSVAAMVAAAAAAKNKASEPQSSGGSVAAMASAAAAKKKASVPENAGGSVAAMAAAAAAARSKTTESKSTGGSVAAMAAAAAAAKNKASEPKNTVSSVAAMAAAAAAARSKTTESKSAGGSVAAMAAAAAAAKNKASESKNTGGSVAAMAAAAAAAKKQASEPMNVGGSVAATAAAAAAARSKTAETKDVGGSIAAMAAAAAKSKTAESKNVGLSGVAAAAAAAAASRNKMNESKDEGGGSVAALAAAAAARRKAVEPEDVAAAGGIAALAAAAAREKDLENRPSPPTSFHFT